MSVNDTIYKFKAINSKETKIFRCRNKKKYLVLKEIKRYFSAMSYFKEIL